uniref:Major facilitator superfamily (MFS) profile domain-containing protein n=1 Tax=Thermogemmatispora argillosa TaxID=2045280 RepID=A0A455SUN4_9CHLR|nr:hypothetical protein KTA_02860 [Thermogemmatispora argillosa]
MPEIRTILKQALAPIRSRDFTVLWLGQTISACGDQCYDIALIWLVTGLTGSSLLVGTLLAINYLPTILMLLIGGVWADRSPRSILLWSDLLRGLLVFLLALAVTLGWVSLPLVICASFIFGLVMAFAGPSLLVLWNMLVAPEDYYAVTSLRQLSQQLALLFGPALGGFLIARWSVPVALLFDAATFVIAVCSTLLLRAQRKPQPSRGGAVSSSPRTFFAELTTGLRFLWREKGILIVVLLIALTNALNNVTGVLVPLLVRYVLHASAAQYGLMAACAGIGTAVGTVAMSLVGKHLRSIATVICGWLVIMGGAITLMGTATTVWLLYIAQMLLGLAFIVVEIVATAHCLQMIPEDQRGKVFSTIVAIAMGLNPLGSLLGGGLGNLVGLRAGLWASGGTIVLLSVLAFLFPPVRALNRPRDAGY